MSTSAGASPQALSINGTMPALAERVDGNPLLAFVDSCLRGVGQVCAVHAGVQLHHPDLPHRRAEPRQRPRSGLVVPGDAQVTSGSVSQHPAIRHRERHRGRPQRDLPWHPPAVLRQQHRGADHHHRRRRRARGSRRSSRWWAPRSACSPGWRSAPRRRPNGLWGFNSFERAGRGRRVLRAHLAVGLLAVACAVLAALLFGAIASLFVPWASPPSRRPSSSRRSRSSC